MTQESLNKLLETSYKQDVLVYLSKGKIKTKNIGDVPFNENETLADHNKKLEETVKNLNQKVLTMSQTINVMSQTVDIMSKNLAILTGGLKKWANY